MDIKSVASKWSEMDAQDRTPAKPLKLSRREKASLSIAFAVAFAITVLYWLAGGRNLFVFPAALCVALIAKHFLPGKKSAKGKYFTRGIRSLPVRKNSRPPNKRR